MADLFDAPNSDVVPFERYCSVIIIYGRHGGGEDNVVHLLGNGPINSFFSLWLYVDPEYFQLYKYCD